MGANKQSQIRIKSGSDEDILIAEEMAWNAGYKKAITNLADHKVPWILRNWLRLCRKPSPIVGSLCRWTTFGVYINYAESISGEWFDKFAIKNGNKIYLPAMPNLAVNSGLHISAQRTFVTNANTTLTPVSGSTNNGVRYGGVDNSSTAVSASTNQFDTTGSNRFIRLFDADVSYSTANRRITGLYTITNADTTIVQRRYGLTNDSANAANTLFSMLGGFILDFNSKAFSITISSQSNWTGS